MSVANTDADVAAVTQLHIGNAMRAYQREESSFRGAVILDNLCRVYRRGLLGFGMCVSGHLRHTLPACCNPVTQCPILTLLIRHRYDGCLSRVIVSYARYLLKR